jgi:hypothetical protein
MADDAPAKAAKGGLDFLKQKAGPLPVGVWLLAGVGIWYYVRRQQAASSPAAGAAANQQTDPAGNVGTIDPATGYVYGTPEDVAALAANNAGTTGGGSASSSATGGAQAYADNNAWGIAAVNYLVGLGIDAATANQAVQLFLSSQPLTTAQQGDVNLAIQALGPPPTLPGPVSSNPAPVTSPGGGSGGGSLSTAPGSAGGGGPIAVKPGAPAKKAGGGGTAAGGGKKPTASVPTGLVVAQKHSTSLQVKWNKSKNATGYHVLCTDMGTKKATNQFDVGAAQVTANCGGLTPGHSYVIDVWAEPEAGAAGTGPHAEVSTTLPKTG